MKKIESILKKVSLVAALLLICQVTIAQNWDDMVRWMRNSGKYRLAELAHPIDYASDKVLSYRVDASTTSITVKVRYQGLMGEYTDTYEIMKGTYRNQPFFRRIRVDEPWDPFCSAFQSIENFGIGYENGYLRSNFCSFYGGEDFRDLSKGEKAAFALFASFISDYRR